MAIEQNEERRIEIYQGHARQFEADRSTRSSRLGGIDRD